MGLAVAIPIAEETKALVPVFKHDACSTIDHVIDKIGTSTDILAYFSSGYYSTLRVCKRMGGSNCYDAALAIGSIFISIAYIVGLATGAYSSNKRDSTRSLAGYLESALRAEGEIFDSIDDMSHTLQARDDSADGQIEIASGYGHIFLPTDGIGLYASTLTKRRSGQALGFKVSYTTRMESKLTHAHRVDIANRSQMSNYIGLWNTDHSICEGDCHNECEITRNIPMWIQAPDL
ncbi:uncharacterized protein BDW43DRAFT_297164 [Aspergillus alliaceus]|uniref:uncharacterized protein n=1 Tax=Petromyces alliaceus TaxID=209559 RepID=UPI0012A65662|nr:uncharacterized protein BDW43DRAFT_297164 [Aspergillus alliaceus]KAB8238256.1 hypothetical protein BDW43DRAFT_297164 [Aspergillus alliaceus]